MGPWTDNTQPANTLGGFRFDSERAPVAVAVHAPSLLGCDALLARELDWLKGLSATSNHLSIGLRGGADACDALADVLDVELTVGHVDVQRPDYVADVLPRSPLLAAERGDCRWSLVGLLVPAESAWIAADVDLPAFADNHGRVDRALLGGHLDALLDAMDACHDTARWPTSRMQQDGWINRRIAIRPSGVAALCSDFDYSHGELHQLIGWISARLQACSRRIARALRPLPAIRDTDPAGSMPRGPQREEWRRRWRDAVDTTAIRHRNLLALSADSLVLAGDAGARANFDLLRLLQHADVIAATGSAHLHSDPEEQRSYRRHLVAALQQRQGLCQIAKHV